MKKKKKSVIVVKDKKGKVKEVFVGTFVRV